MSGDHDKYGTCRTRFEMQLVDQVCELDEQLEERDKRIAELEKELSTVRLAKVTETSEKVFKDEH